MIESAGSLLVAPMSNPSITAKDTQTQHWQRRKPYLRQSISSGAALMALL